MAVVQFNPDPTLEERFAEFYLAYPRKKARKDAFKAYLRECLDGVTHEHIMAGVQRMVAGLPNPLTAEKKKYIPYPATWLRAGGYDDEPDGDEDYRYDDSWRVPTPEEAEVHRTAFGRATKMVKKDNPVSDFVKDRARQKGWRG